MSERTVFDSIPHRHVVSVPPSAFVWELACVMTKAISGSVLVVDSLGEMHGIVTESDITMRCVAKGADPATTRVGEVMTQNPLTVGPDTKVLDALRIMLERGFHSLPIVTNGSKVLGVFSVRDALPYELNEASSIAEFNQQVNDALA